MSLVSNTADLRELLDKANSLPTIDEVYADGIQAEYDRFWDAFQQNGNKVNYRYAFSGNGWTEETLRPKYPIKIVDSTTTSRNGAYMFHYLNIRGTEPFDMTEICKVVDFSVALSIQGLCQNAYATNLTIDASKATTCANAFGCNDGGDINNITLTVSDACTNFSNTFHYCSTLTDLTFTEGSQIAASVNFQWSPLTVASMKSVISALKNFTGTVSEYTQTVKFSDACWVALEADSTAPHGGTWKDYVYTVLCWNT